MYAKTSIRLRLLLWLAICGVLAPFAQAQETTRLSVDAMGVEADSKSSRPSISADGSRIAFYSDATNLVANDTNAVRDVFMVDRQTGTIGRVSVGSGEEQSNGKSSRPFISADGRHVAFYSDADNLVSGDGNGVRDCFVRDTLNGTTARVSVSSAGIEGDGASSRPTLSDDGRFVAFYSDASNLVAGDFNGVRDAFLHDRDTDEDGIYDEPGAISTIRVSVSSAGVQGNLESSIPVVSGNGRHVTFRSVATNLVAGDTNGKRDVFAHDRITGTTSILSLSTAGVLGNGDSSRPQVSTTGRYVTFYSDADNLVAGDTNEYCFFDAFMQLICVPANDCFVRDRDVDNDGIYDEPGAVATIRVSVASDGSEGNSRSEDPDISGDGRYVTFWTEATNLFVGDTNGMDDVVLHDRDSDGDGVYDEPGAVATTVISVSGSGAQGNAESKRPVVSGNGSVVAFRSDADNLVPGDTNLVSDVFLRRVHKVRRTAMIPTVIGGTSLLGTWTRPRRSLLLFFSGENRSDLFGFGEIRIDRGEVSLHVVSRGR